MKEFAFALVLAGLCSCQPENSPENITRAIYHWKTNWDPNAGSLKTLSNLESNTIYLRLFDVCWDETGKKAIPVAQTDFAKLPDDSLVLIPVVFITNEVFLKVSIEEVGLLTKKIHLQVNEIMKTFKRDFTEVQIDCDWTESSRQNYFSFLEELKKLFSDTWMHVSATIRLHQIKYPDKTGVPPVDRGMLMFYNMGKIQSGKTPNSIFNQEDALKYTSYISDYSLPLDVALPLFSWTIHSRNGNMIALLSGIDERHIHSVHGIKSDSGLYHAELSMTFYGTYLQQGDELKIERVDHALCMEAAQLLNMYLKKEKRSVVIFDLDSLTINAKDEKDLEKIYTIFNPTYAKASVGTN